MIIPVYIGEAAPSHIRGTLITIYQFMVAFGFVVANAFAAWFAHYDPVNLGWRLMFSLAAVPAATQVISLDFRASSLLYEHNSETIDITTVEAITNQNSTKFQFFVTRNRG